MQNNVIAKTFHMLKAFTDHQRAWGVNELARFLRMPVSSVHRMMQMLKEENILSFSDESQKYEIGEEFIRMSSIVLANSDIKQIAHPYLEQVSDMTGHSAYFAQYYKQHKQMAFIDCVRSASGLQYVLELGVLQPIHIAASGKTILAHLEAEEMENILNREEVYGIDREKIYKELEDIRKIGYAITSNERKQGALSIGSPIFDAKSQVIGSLICVMPHIDYTESLKETYVECVINNASTISHLLGYSR